MPTLRLVDATNGVEYDGALTVPGQPSPHWPKTGSIAFDKVVMR